MTEPYTSEFGAVPTPEEPARLPDPSPHTRYQDIPGHNPAAFYGQPPYAPPAYSPFAPQGPQANAAVVNNIRIGGVRPFNHMLHLTLTVLTCGAWAPVWVIAYVLRPKA